MAINESFISKRLKLRTRKVYEKVQGVDTNQVKHKKLWSKKMLAKTNYPPYQKRSSRGPGKIIALSGMSAL